jgi:hypothetical protein
LAPGDGPLHVIELASTSELMAKHMKKPRMELCRCRHRRLCEIAHKDVYPEANFPVICSIYDFVAYRTERGWKTHQIIFSNEFDVLCICSDYISSFSIFGSVGPPALASRAAKLPLH